MSCRTGPLRSATPQTKTCLRGLRFERPLCGVCIFSCKGDLLWSSRWLEKDHPDQREGLCGLSCPDRYARHEVAAPRAVGSSGRTSVSNRFLVCLPRGGLLCRDRRSDHLSLRRTLHNLQRITLQRTHLHHLTHVIPQHGQIDKPDVKSRHKELTRSGHMDRARRSRRQRLVPEPLKVEAACVARLRRLEDLVRLHVQKSQPHRSMPHDAFHVSAPSTPAEALLLIERHYRVSALPDALSKRIASKANPDTQRPHPNHAVQLPMRRSKPRCHRIGIVQDRHGCRVQPMAPQLGQQQLLYPRTLQLRQVWSLFHHSILHQPRHGNANGRKILRPPRPQTPLVAYPPPQRGRGQLHQPILLVVVLREAPHRTDELVIHDKPDRNSFR